MKACVILALAPLLAACATSPAVEIIAPPVVQIYHPPLPAKVVMREVKWEVLTRQQLLDLIEQHQQTQQPLVLYALREQGFENIAMNIQELKRYILESRAVIDYYRRVQENVTEPVDGQQSTRDFSGTAPQRALTSDTYIETQPLYEFKVN